MQDILSCTFNLFELLIRKIDKKDVEAHGCNITPFLLNTQIFGDYYMDSC